jgi:hypothetical protein
MWLGITFRQANAALQSNYATGPKATPWMPPCSPAWRGSARPTAARCAAIGIWRPSRQGIAERGWRARTVPRFWPETTEIDCS